MLCVVMMSLRPVPILTILCPQLRSLHQRPDYRPAPHSALRASTNPHLPLAKFCNLDCLLVKNELAARQLQTSKQTNLAKLPVCLQLNIYQDDIHHIMVIKNLPSQKIGKRFSRTIENKLFALCCFKVKLKI